MNKRKILFSVNTVLAYRISSTYYNNLHFVWCSDKYDYGMLQPSSSNPLTIVQRYLQDVYSRDDHSAIIKQNKEGLIRGAAIKRANGVVTEEVEKKIITIVNNADFEFFMPLLYVIPYNNVATICQPVSAEKKARFDSTEYIIEMLPRQSFEVINIGKTVSGFGGEV